MFYLNKVVEGNMSRTELASYQLQEVYERTLLEIKQEASEEEE